MKIVKDGHVVEVTRVTVMVEDARERAEKALSVIKEFNRRSSIC